MGLNELQEKILVNDWGVNRWEGEWGVKRWEILSAHLFGAAMYSTTSRQADEFFLLSEIAAIHAEGDKK